MYARSVSFILSIILFVLPLLASAAAVRRGGGAPSGSCDPAGIQCCATSEAATSSDASAIMSLLGINAGTVNGLIGLNCNPLTVIGISGTSCTSQPLCCSDNSFKSLGVALGCTPIIL